MMNNIYIYIYVYICIYTWARAQYRQFSRINNSEIHETLSDHNYAIFEMILQHLWGGACEFCEIVVPQILDKKHLGTRLSFRPYLASVNGHLGLTLFLPGSATA